MACKCEDCTYIHDSSCWRFQRGRDEDLRPLIESCTNYESKKK